MTDEERKKLIFSIYKEQDALADEMNIELETTIDFEKLNSMGIEIPIIKTFDMDSVTIKSISELSYMDDSVFAKWKVTDLPVMFLAGALGTFTSTQLRECFDDFHKAKGRTPTLKGGHGFETADRVPGSAQSGGFGHRTKYGHDLFNPFEIDWSDYLEKAKASGTILPPWLKAYFYWLRHLLQDTFSAEGLPMPGNTLIRNLVNPAAKNTRETLQIFNTIKMRDVVGAGVTNIVMGGYLWGTEKSLKRVVVEPNYRAFSLMLGANVTSLLIGLFLPTKLASFNWSTIPVIGYYGCQLLKLEKKVRQELNNRDKQLSENERVISENESILNQISIFDDQVFEELLHYEKELFEYNEQVLRYHEKVKKSILMEA